MPERLGRFEMPKKVIKEEEGPTYGRYILEPLEQGYGVTLGNALRRVLLSSIEGAAITSVKIEGAPHEFCSLPGCVEDVTEIILNLKKVRFKCYTRSPKVLRLTAKGPCEVLAGHIEVDNMIEVVNPNLHIADLAEDGKLNMEITVKIGRGYCPAEMNKGPDDELGRIAMDSIFSPVTKVNFRTENTRVGRRTDYDRLILEIWTDGTITPDSALTVAASILRHHMDVFLNLDVSDIEIEEKERVDEEREKLRKKLMMSVNEIELSVRAANCLNNANITTVGQLVQQTEASLLKYRNFGKKSLKEIQDRLAELGLSLGMKIDPSLLEPAPSEEKLNQ